MPTLRHHLVQHVRGDLDHGDDADGQRSDGQDAELDDFREHHAEHAALDHIKCRDAHQDESVGVVGKMPRQEFARELANPFRRIRQEADDTDQRKNHHDDVRGGGAAALAEPGLDPFRAGHHIGPPQPDGHIDHQENLVEHRPEPRQPYALHAVGGRHIHQPHGAGNIEHTRRVGNPQHIPRQFVPAQKVGLHVLGRPLGHPEADEDGGDQIEADYGQVNGM